MSTPETAPEAARLTGFDHDGLHFDVVDSGPLDGEVIVLLHGWPERASSWRGVSALLNEAGYRTLAPDQRGYSPGARPKGRRAYEASRLARDVIALVDAAGVERVHLVGHDWGSAVAWATAMLHPDRLHSLTAVSVGHPGAFMRSFLRSDQARRSWYMLFFQLPKVPELLATRTDRMERLLRRAGMREEELTRYRDEVLGAGALTTSLNWYRALPLSNPRTSATSVRVPTTMVWSDRDGALGRTGIEMTEAYVDADYDLVVIEGASHWIPTQEPERLATAILDRARGAA